MVVVWPQNISSCGPTTMQKPLPQKMDCSDIALQHIPNAATPRAWQLFEQDGRRTQVWRTPPNDALYAMLRPHFDTLPEAFRAARGMALGINPNSPSIELMQQIKQATHAAGGLCAVEPFCPAVKPVDASVLRDMVTFCDVFSPNALEAASILGVCQQTYTARDMVLALLGGWGILCVLFFVYQPHMCTAVYWNAV